MRNRVIRVGIPSLKMSTMHGKGLTLNFQHRDTAVSYTHLFKYENESYHIEIDDVAVFPQCYAAVVDKIPTMAKDVYKRQSGRHDGESIWQNGIRGCGGDFPVYYRAKTG